MTRGNGSRRGSSRAVSCLASLLLSWACLTWAPHASAALVAIVSTGSSSAISETTHRLRGELAALRFDVMPLRRPSLREGVAEDSRAWLERAAEEDSLDAAIEIVGDGAPPALDVWIFQRSPRRVQLARVAVEPGTTDPAGALAIRAIEVLRSYDLEAELAARPRAAEQDAAAPAAPAPSRDSPSAGRDASSAPSRVDVAGRASVELGASLLVGLDGVGPSLLPIVRLGWRAHRVLIVQATFSGFGTQPELSGAAGSVRVGQSYGTLGICYCPASRPAFSPYASLAAGFLRTSLSASATSPATAHTVAHGSLLLDAGFGARLRLSDQYYATLTAHVQLAQSRVAIHAIDERLGSTGRPNVIGNLTLGAWL